MQNATVSGEFGLAEVKKAFTSLVAGKNPFITNARRAEELLANWNAAAERPMRGRRSFYGSSPEEMIQWCKDGYPLSIPTIHTAMTKRANKRKFIRAEEGELILEAAYSGEDMPFLNQTKLPARPGLRIVAEYSTLESTPPAALAAYGKFLGELSALYQSKGYDLGLSISLPGHDRFRKSGKSETLITLKREGQMSEPKEWSAIFAPSGYRMLGFVSHLMLGDKHKLTVVSTMGRTRTSGKFNATFDKPTRTLKITVPNSYQEFPAAMLRDKIERLGI